MSETARLCAIMDLMREKRALRVKVEGLEVELSPLAFPDAPSGAPAGRLPIPVDEARCPCGCPLSEHGDHGLCLNGCEEGKCQPAMEATA